MNKRALLGATAFRTFTAAGLAAGMWSPALAQTVPADSTAPEAPQSEPQVASSTTANTDEVIVITGSRIRRPNLDSAVPITSISGQEFFETGHMRPPQLQLLPQIV